MDYTFDLTNNVECNHSLVPATNIPFVNLQTDNYIFTNTVGYHRCEISLVTGINSYPTALTLWLTIGALTVKTVLPLSFGSQLWGSLLIIVNSSNLGIASNFAGVYNTYELSNADQIKIEHTASAADGSAQLMANFWKES